MTTRNPNSSTARSRTAAKKTASKAAAKKTASKKTTAKKKAEKKTATKKSASKKTATKSASKKTATKSASKKTATKSASKKTATKKSASKKTATKKSASKKTAAKKTGKRPAKRRPAPPPRPPALPADVRARLHAVLAAADPTLILVDAEHGITAGDEQRARYVDNTWDMGTLWGDALWSACRHLVQGFEKVAETPPFTIGFMTAIKNSAAFFIDTTRPDLLFYALNPEMPAALFIPVAIDEASIAHAIAEYRDERPASVDLRAWMGFGNSLRIPNVYSGELVAVDDHELDRFFVFSPVASNMARRTYFSGSHFAYETHGEDLYIWDLAYPPCTTSAPVVRRFNATTGYNFPLDMPVDLVSAIHGFEFATFAELEARTTAEPPGTVAAILTVLAAIGWKTLATPLQLRTHTSNDATVQRALCSVGLMYGWERLVWDQLPNVEDTELQANIAAVLSRHELDTPAPDSGERRVLAPGADPVTLVALAEAHGWTVADLPDDSKLALDIHLPGHTEDSPRRIVWRDVPALELSTLAFTGAADVLPLLDAAVPAAPPSDDRWRTAATLAWQQDQPSPALLDLLRAALAAEAWTERLIAARLIGHARVHAAIGLVRAALAAESHDATRSTLEATVKHLGG